MSNYSKTTDFEAKDSLPTGDSGKIIRGSEFETEFDAISTAIATKADTAGPTFTGTLTFETISDGTINVTAFVDEDNMASNSATLVPTQQSVKAYVDSQLTAQDLDFQADSGGALSIDLDSETMTFTGGTGIDTSGSGNAVTFAIDSTVATLTGTQTLTNKTLTSPDVNTPDIDGGTIDNTVIGGSTAAAGSFTSLSATGNITVGGTVDGRDVATDGSKLDGIEASATADQTASEIRTLVESASDSNVFTDADHSKLDGIEASADVTDATNVTAAGALMDSELTSIASVKALNQGVATSDSPTFAAVTVNGNVEFDGLSGTGSVTVTDILDQDDMSGNSATALATQQSIKAYVDSQVATADTLSEVLANGNTTGGANIVFGDSSGASDDRLIFGAGSDLQIYHDGSASFISDQGTGNLKILATDLQVRNAGDSGTLLTAVDGGAVTLKFNSNTKLATTNTGIDVTGTVTTDGITTSGVIKAPDGSASAPAYTNTGDSDGGMFFPAANELAFSTGGSERVRIDNNGLVGIGTSGPTHLLHIEASDDSVLRLTRTGVRSFSQYVNSAGKFIIRDLSGTPADRLAIDSSGNVGIGTSSIDSGSKVHIQESDASLAAATGASLALFERAGNAGITIATANTGDATLFFGDPDSMTVGRVNYDHNDNSLQLWSNSAERMRIDSSGNLLVGQSAQVSPGFGNTQTGSGIRSNGNASFSRSGNSTQPTLMLNKNTNDGTIASFQKDGTTVGTIATTSNRISIGSNDVGLFFDSTNERFTPIDQTNQTDRDAAIDLGYASSRFKDLFLSGDATAERLIIRFSTTDHLQSVLGSDGGGFAVEDNNYFAIWHQDIANVGTDTGLTERFRVDSSGNFLLNGTNATGKLVVDGDANAYTARFNSSTTTGQAFGARVRAGTNSSDFAVLVENTSASTMFAVRGDGNVGIGTSSPSEELEISAALPTIRLTDTDDSSYANIFYNAPNLIFDSDAGNSDGSSNIQFRIDGTEAARILSSGNVGLGTSAPESLLELEATSSTVFDGTDTSGQATAGTTLAIQNLSDTNNTFSQILFRNRNSSKAVSRIASLTDSTGTEMAFVVENNGSPAEVLRLEKTGNVGINTTSPEETLSVMGDFQVALNTSVTGRGLKVSTSNTSITDDTVAINAQASTGILAFQTNSSERLRINASGNVGINQSNPTRKLHVTSAGSGVVATFGDSEANNTLEVTRTTSNASYAALLATSAVGGFVAGPTMTFSTSNSGGGSVTERARFDSSGNFMLNTTTQSGQVSVDNGGNTTGVYVLQSSSSVNHTGISVQNSYVTGSQTGTMIRFIQTDGSTVGTISSTTSATTYNTSSDQRLKDNIVDAPSASTDIDAIQVRSFDWKADGSHQKYGMVAQELQSVAPEAVTGDADSDEMMGVDYSKLVPMMMKEIQSLRARVAQLEGVN